MYIPNLLKNMKKLSYATSTTVTALKNYFTDYMMIILNKQPNGNLFTIGFSFSFVIKNYTINLHI